MYRGRWRLKPLLIPGASSPSAAAQATMFAAAMVLLLQLIPNTAADDTVYTSAQAVKGERARLPCDVTSTLPKDRAVLILWYRGAAGTPIYSFDARGIQLEDGKHWGDERMLAKRAYFQLLPGHTWGGSPASGAHLELYPTQDHDQAVYRCRVDFMLSPTKNTIINFTVIIQPSKPEIYNASMDRVDGGDRGASIIGPYNEGDPLQLTCMVYGGRPNPTVRWYINDELVTSGRGAGSGSQYSSATADAVPQEDGSVQATLLVPELTRDDLHAVFECQATNFNDSTPISSAVTLDMNFRPENVTILSLGTSLSSGIEYELVCQAWGSRPPATITWWKGGTAPLQDQVMSTSADANVTTSMLKYIARPDDSGKLLTCRAENPLIADSSREDGLKIDVYYAPVVSLQIGSNLDPENIKEKDDVYFECLVNANPEAQRVTWYHNGSPIVPRASQGVLIQNQTLVLQGVMKESAGFYTCRASNIEGEGESQPLELRVMYAPYCKRLSKTIYGTALLEPAAVTCEVEANPGPVTFRWTFNNTSEHLPIPASAVTSNSLVSVASYAPKSHLEYGTLLCWAFNEIGQQIMPCSFTIIPAGPPDPLKNCTIVNQTTDAILVQCDPGFAGGLTPHYYMEVYDSTMGDLLRNISSTEPQFYLNALRPGLAFVMKAYTANTKGISDKFQLETFTLKVAEKRTGPPGLLDTSFLGIIIGIVLAAVLVAFVIMVVMRLRKPHQHTQDMHQISGNGHKEVPARIVETSKPNNINNKTGGYNATKDDPDLIPQKQGSLTYDSLNRSSNHISTPASADNNLPPVHSLPRKRNLYDPRVGTMKTYVELALPADAAPGYQVSASDLCLYATMDRQQRGISGGTPYSSVTSTTVPPISYRNSLSSTLPSVPGTPYPSVHKAQHHRRSLYSSQDIGVPAMSPTMSPAMSPATSVRTPLIRPSPHESAV